MSAIDDFDNLVSNTDVIKQLQRSLREEPASVLGDVCREYQKTGQPLPDHRLPYYGFLGEAAIRALIAAGLIKRRSGGAVSLYSYEPTQDGLIQYEKLKAEGFYDKKKS